MKSPQTRSSSLESHNRSVQARRRPSKKSEAFALRRDCSAIQCRNRFGILFRTGDSCRVFAVQRHVIILCLATLAPAGCQHHDNAVSGTIEVDEVHVGPRSAGRVEQIFAWEGDHLRVGQPIVQLEASELKARRDLAEAQINTAIHDADAQQAQLEFLRDDAKRQEDLLKRKVVSPNDAERAVSAARSQEKNVEAAKMRVTQARAQLADIDSQLAEMQVVAPADSVLEVLSVKVGDVLPANREVATLLLTGHLWVRVYVPEPWLGKIKVGEHVRARTDSFPDKDFDGVVEQINRQAEFTPRNVQTVGDRIKQVFGVKVRLPNNDDRLRAGMAADVYFMNVK
jgi:HlyD family secretion protein